MAYPPPPPAASEANIPDLLVVVNRIPFFVGNLRTTETIKAKTYDL